MSPSVIRVIGLRAEHHREPLGLGTARPRLSWQVETGQDLPAGWLQAAYEVSVDGTGTGRVDSAEQVLVPWPAGALAPATAGPSGSGSGAPTTPSPPRGARPSPSRPACSTPATGSPP
ncbi:hypothetical protein OHA72_25310 [Dactylosporangium sp. NBC_01737]|nr:hypothetical protein OHA72_25310 [Dactylosporangium sp. NBC_01737]